MKHKWTVVLSLILVFALFGATLPVSAAAGACYTIGSYPFVESEIQALAYYWGRMGYSSWYTIEQGSSYITSTRLNSPVVAFYGHGSASRMTIQKDATSSPYYITAGYSTTNGVDVGLCSFSFPSNQLMIFGGCQTGAYSVNLVTTAIDQGSSSAIGWIGNVALEDINIWIPRFQYGIYRGYTVQQAVNYANNFTDYNSQSTVTNVRVYGGTTTIPHYGSRSISDFLSAEQMADIASLQQYTVDYPVGDSVEQSALACIAQVTGKQLVAGSYVLESTPVSDDGFAYYCFRYMRGDFEMNAGITVTVKNGRITQIAEKTAATTATASVMSTPPTVTEADRAAAITQANTEVATRYPAATITEQSGKNFYDVKKNEYYYLVSSLYEFEDGTMGNHLTFYTVG